MQKKVAEIFFEAKIDMLFFSFSFLNCDLMFLMCRVVPGTASRLLASAMQKRPVSRGGIGLQTPLNIADRPVTQQGLSGLRTGGGTGKM